MRYLDLSKFKHASHLSSGRHSSLFTGSGVEFAELREFREGGDVRAIDWKSSLRSGRTLEKEYVPDREIPVWFVLDVSSSMGYGPDGGRAIDTALSAFDLVVASARKYGNPVAAMAFSERVTVELPPSRSFSNALSFRRKIESSMRAVTGPSYSWAFPLQELRSRIRSKSVVFVVSDRDFEFLPETGKALRRSNAFFLRIRHPLEDSKSASDVAVSGRSGVAFVDPATLRKPENHDNRTSFPRQEVSAGGDPYSALEKLLTSAYA